MDAQGAVDSLLGHLTNVLVSEAKLLGGIRSDVEFIKDEMESMKAFLLHLSEAQHKNHQVRAWVKQIIALTRDCGGNVELYLRYVASGGDESGDKGAVLGFLLSIPRFLRTVSVRHQIATRIQELKVRVRDVADRRLRYDVTVPNVEPDPYQYQDLEVDTVDETPAPQPGSQEEEVEIKRRELLHHTCTTEPSAIPLVEGTKKILERLLKKGEDGTMWPTPCVIFVKHSDAASAPGVGWSVYKQCSSLVSAHIHTMYADLEKLDRLEHDPNDYVFPWSMIRDKLPNDLKGIVSVIDKVQYPRHAWIVQKMVNMIYHDEGSIIVSTIQEDRDHNPLQEIPNEQIIQEDLYDCFEHRVSDLANKCSGPKAREICLECRNDAFALRMFLGLIYVNPKWAERDMEKLLHELQDHKSNTFKVMLRFCYKDLPSNHRDCLLYLSIFPRGHKIRRTSLVRRWLAEGLVSRRRNNLRLKGVTTLDGEAEHIIDALVARGFLHPEETSAAGKIKTFEVPFEVHKFIVAASRYVYMGNTSMPPELAHRLSINNGVEVELQEVSSLDRPSDDVLTLLDKITPSVPWQLLKVLDLEGCKGLTKMHLKAICQIMLLRYLSLRNTGVNELPKQIEELQCLETLDIRETKVETFSPRKKKVQTFSKTQIKLPMLRYFLAGHKESPSKSFTKFKDATTSVSLPRGIRGMRNLQVLSYVDITDNMDDLNDVCVLKHLRKLGVILNWKKADRLSALFQLVEKLHGSLRSLSIRISKAPGTGPQATAMNTPPKRLRSTSLRISQLQRGRAADNEQQATDMQTPPRHLQSLKISGVTTGLPLWIKHLEQLERISLSETYLLEDAIYTLGTLPILRCLQLLQGSYTPSILNFKADEFQQLRSLVVVVEGINSINFDKGTTPKLRTIVCHFHSNEALSGLVHLPELKKLELQGDCNQELDDYPALEYTRNQELDDYPALEYTPRHQHQEHGTTAAEASSSP